MEVSGVVERLRFTCGELLLDSSSFQEIGTFLTKKASSFELSSRRSKPWASRVIILPILLIVARPSKSLQPCAIFHVMQWNVVVLGLFKELVSQLQINFIGPL